MKKQSSILNCSNSIVLATVFLFINCQNTRKANQQAVSNGSSFYSGVDTLDKTKENACAVAKQLAINATALSHTSGFDSARAEILRAYNADKKEYVIAFGKDDSGSVILSPINSGGNYSSNIPIIKNRFADIHNHPGNGPPFSHDIYGLIDEATSNENYQRFVITGDGLLYAIVVTDIKAARKFNTDYPRQKAIGDFELRFPDSIVDEIREAEFLSKGNKAVALALILVKYNSGIALLIQTAGRDFKRLVARESNGSLGEKVYVDDYCE